MDKHTKRYFYDYHNIETAHVGLSDIADILNDDKADFDSYYLRQALEEATEDEITRNVFKEQIIKRKYKFDD